MVRVSVLYDGYVQGVGFRYTVISLVDRRPITGFVRNDYNGKVTLVAEGEEAELEKFLEAIRSSYLGRYIQKEDISWSPATGEYAVFGVVH